MHDRSGFTSLCEVSGEEDPSVDVSQAGIMIAPRETVAHLTAQSPASYPFLFKSRPAAIR